MPSFCELQVEREARDPPTAEELVSAIADCADRRTLYCICDLRMRNRAHCARAEALWILGDNPACSPSLPKSSASDWCLPIYVYLTSHVHKVVQLTN